MQIWNESATFGAAIGDAAEVVAAEGAKAELEAFLAEARAVKFECIADGVEGKEEEEQGLGEGDRFEMAIEVGIGGVQTPELEAKEGVGFPFVGFVVGVGGAGIRAVLEAGIPGEQGIDIGWRKQFAIHEADAAAAGPKLSELIAAGAARPGVEEGVAGGVAADPEAGVGDAKQEQQRGQSGGEEAAHCRGKTD